MASKTVFPTVLEIMKSPEFTGEEAMDHKAFHIRSVIKSGKHGQVALCESGDEDGPWSKVAIKTELIKSPQNPHARPYREYFILKQLGKLAERREFYPNPQWVGFIQILDWFKAKSDQVRITEGPFSPEKTPTKLNTVPTKLAQPPATTARPQRAASALTSSSPSTTTSIRQNAPKTAPKSTSVVSRLSFGNENADSGNISSDAGRLTSEVGKLNTSMTSMALSPAKRASRNGAPTPTPKRVVPRTPLLLSTSKKQREIKLQEGNLVLERADTTLYNIRHSVSFEIWRDLLFQILYALYVSQSQFEFMHHDLHLQNVLLKKVKDSRNPLGSNSGLDEKIGIFKDEDTTWYSKGPWIVKLSDFGLSRITLVDGSGDVVYDVAQPLSAAFVADRDVLKILEEFSRVKITRWLTREDLMSIESLNLASIKATSFEAPDWSISLNDVLSTMQPQEAIDALNAKVEEKQKAIKAIRAHIRKQALHLQRILHHEFFNALKTPPSTLWTATSSADVSASPASRSPSKSYLGVGTPGGSSPFACSSPFSGPVSPTRLPDLPTTPLFAAAGTTTPNGTHMSTSIPSTTPILAFATVGLSTSPESPPLPVKRLSFSAAALEAQATTSSTSSSSAASSSAPCAAAAGAPTKTPRTQQATARQVTPKATPSTTPAGSDGTATRSSGHDTGAADLESTRARGGVPRPTNAPRLPSGEPRATPKGAPISVATSSGTENSATTTSPGPSKTVAAKSTSKASAVAPSSSSSSRSAPQPSQHSVEPLQGNVVILLESVSIADSVRTERRSARVAAKSDASATALVAKKTPSKPLVKPDLSVMVTSPQRQRANTGGGAKDEVKQKPDANPGTFLAVTKICAPLKAAITTTAECHDPQACESGESSLTHATTAQIQPPVPTVAPTQKSKTDTTTAATATATSTETSQIETATATRKLPGVTGPSALVPAPITGTASPSSAAGCPPAATSTPTTSPKSASPSRSAKGSTTHRKARRSTILPSALDSVLPLTSLDSAHASIEPSGEEHSAENSDLSLAAVNHTLAHLTLDPSATTSSAKSSQSPKSHRLQSPRHAKNTAQEVGVTLSLDRRSGTPSPTRLEYGPIPARFIDPPMVLPMLDSEPINCIEALRDFLVRRAQKLEELGDKRRKALHAFFVRDELQLAAARVERLAKKRRKVKRVVRHSLGGARSSNKEEIRKKKNDESSSRPRRKSISTSRELDVSSDLQSSGEDLLEQLVEKVSVDANGAADSRLVLDLGGLSRSGEEKQSESYAPGACSAMPVAELESSVNPESGVAPSPGLGWVAQRSSTRAAAARAKMIVRSSDSRRESKVMVPYIAVEAQNTSRRPDRITSPTVPTKKRVSRRSSLTPVPLSPLFPDLALSDVSLASLSPPTASPKPTPASASSSHQQNATQQQVRGAKITPRPPTPVKPITQPIQSAQPAPAASPATAAAASSSASSSPTMASRPSPTNTKADSSPRLGRALGQPGPKASTSSEPTAPKATHTGTSTGQRTTRRSTSTR